MNILRELNNLTVAELDRVIETAKGLRQFASTGRPAAAQATTLESYDYVLAVACGVCMQLGKDLRTPSVAKRMQSYKAFQREIPTVSSFIQTFAPTRDLEVAVLRLAYTHMATEWSYGLARMLSATALIPRALGEIFPGYYQAGLMSIPIRRLRGGG